MARQLFEKGQLVRVVNYPNAKYGEVVSHQGDTVFARWLRPSGAWSDGKTFLDADTLAPVVSDEDWAEYAKYVLSIC